MSDNSSTSPPSPTSKPEKTRKTLILLITAVTILSLCITVSLYYSQQNHDTSARLEVKVRTEGFGYPYRLSFTDESTKVVYEAKLTVGSSSSVNGTFIFDNIPAGQYDAYIYHHQLGLPLTSGNGGVTESVAVISVTDGYNTITIDQSPTLGHPPDYPIEYTYGLESNITSAAKLWVDPPWATALLQPTWPPEGMKQTAVYVQNSDVMNHTGKITQVTTLFSRGGISDPWTAEIQLRVQMAWNIGWLDPHPNMKLGIEGNYTTISGYPAYVGLIGWSEGGYSGMYGGTARIVSIRIGYTLYVFRAPESVPISDLIKMAISLKPI